MIHTTGSSDCRTKSQQVARVSLGAHLTPEPNRLGLGLRVRADLGGKLRRAAAEIQHNVAELPQPNITVGRHPSIKAFRRAVHDIKAVADKETCLARHLLDLKENSRSLTGICANSRHIHSAETTTALIPTLAETV